VFGLQNEWMKQTETGKLGALDIVFGPDSVVAMPVSLNGRGKYPIVGRRRLLPAVLRCSTFPVAILIAALEDRSRVAV
jgi:hypothetical protein